MPSILKQIRRGSKDNKGKERWQMKAWRKSLKASYAPQLNTETGEQNVCNTLLYAAKRHSNRVIH